MPDDNAVILCVDDDPDILEFLDVVLSGAGYRFIGATSAEEGLHAFREHAPAAIILDLMMEEVDSGAGLAKELRLRGNQAPVFLLSSIGDGLANATDYSPFGVVGVFQKPLAAQQLLLVLEATLAGAPVG